jgi:hypothetical protein
MGLMSDNPNVFCCKYRMTEGVVHKTRYTMGIKTYALHTVNTKETSAKGEEEKLIEIAKQIIHMRGHNKIVRLDVLWLGYLKAF